MKGSTALLLLVACTFAMWAAADARELLGPYPYNQCGGQGGVCSRAAGSKTPCVDAQWPGFKCKTGFTCFRVSNWYRQCDTKKPPTKPDGPSPVPAKPTVKPTAPIPASAYKQCGGRGGACSGKTLSKCRDAKWPDNQGGKCYPGLTCFRVSQWHWGCDVRDPPCDKGFKKCEKFEHVGPSGRKCFDLMTDSGHCGACSNVCPGRSQCFKGVCK